MSKSEVRCPFNPSYNCTGSCRLKKFAELEDQSWSLIKDGMIRRQGVDPDQVSIIIHSSRMDFIDETTNYAKELGYNPDYCYRKMHAN